MRIICFEPFRSFALSTNYLPTAFFTASWCILLYTAIVQYFGHTLLSFNRFTLLWFPLKKQLWTKNWYIYLLLGLPLLNFTYQFYEPTTFVFIGEYSVFPILVNSNKHVFGTMVLNVIYIITTSLAAIFNALSLYKAFYGINAKNLKINERRLLCRFKAICI